MTAASLIGQGQPDVAKALFRRAIETGKVAIAVKKDPANAKKWASVEKRRKRWQARLKGKRPELFRDGIKVDHPIIEDLMKIYGTASDSGLHFTPEYFHSLEWKKRKDEMRLNYFCSDERVLKREIVTMVGVYVNLLHIFNECLDGVFGKDEEWKTLFSELHQIGKPYADTFGPSK